MITIPGQWRNEFEGEAHPDESWELRVEHDLVNDGDPYMVTIDGKQSDHETNAFAEFCICIDPEKALEVANALIVSAHLAEKANARRKGQ